MAGDTLPLRCRPVASRWNVALFPQSCFDNASRDRVGTGAFARPGVRQRLEQIMAEEKVDEKAALKKVAKERGISKSEVYRELQRSK
jgi:hypothetical protein